MKKYRFLLKLVFLSLFWVAIRGTIVAQNSLEPMETGKYEPTWESLKQYSTAPDWFRDAKFGIWAHWGPQCQPEQGDWFARSMYFEGKNRDWFTVNFGTDSKLGFKEVINSWKAENWNPEELVKFYKEVGAKYFFALANHHDNLDLWDSKYQPWNTVKVGPKKDILAAWEKAARKNGLYFGISIHAAHAWTWYEGSQNYDGNLSKADGKGLWWDGLDPKDLYAQNHTPSENWNNQGSIHKQWDWTNGASVPSKEYCDKFYNRTMDIINKFQPDLLYFDDTSLPLIAVDKDGKRSTSISDAGLKIAANFYNKSANKNKGKANTVIFGKILTEEEKECIVWDVERGVPDKPQNKPWQTCTCIGDWHYKAGRKYKSAKSVIHMLIDVVSKNGNLLLNIPLKGDGTYDTNELQVLKGIKAWLDINKESIYGTRPWLIFGEGTTAEKSNKLNAQGFNEGIKYDSSDIRYVIKGKKLYATVMGYSDSKTLLLKSLGSNSAASNLEIKSVKLLGGKKLSFVRNADGLTINLPNDKLPTADIASVFEIQLQ